MRQSHPRHFGEGAGHLDADRPAAHECKCQKTPNFPGRCLFRRLRSRSNFFSPLERKQDFAANHVGIIERFQARRETAPLVRATASQCSTMSLRRVAMIAISSLCSAAGTLYLSRASERWPTTMSNAASVTPSPACTVFAERLITLHGPPVTLHTRFLVFCLNNSRVSVPIPTKYLPTFGSTNSRSSKSSTTAEMPL